MKEYNFDEMQEMQAKALERVRDMQARAQTVAREADRELSDNSETERGKTQTESAYKENFYNAVKSTPNKNRISMPVELSQSKPYESFKEYFEPINKKAKQENEKTVKADLLDTVFKEPDKALLLALLLLLQADGADEELLMSLLYIML